MSDPNRIAGTHGWKQVNDHLFQIKGFAATGDDYVVGQITREKHPLAPWRWWSSMYNSTVSMATSSTLGGLALCRALMDTSLGHEPLKGYHVKGYKDAGAAVFIFARNGDEACRLLSKSRFSGRYANVLKMSPQMLRTLYGLPVDYPLKYEVLIADLKEE